MKNDNKQEFWVEGSPITGNFANNAVGSHAGTNTEKPPAIDAFKNTVEIGGKKYSKRNGALHENALPKNGKVYGGLSSSHASILPPDTDKNIKDVPPPATKFTASDLRKNKKGNYEEEQSAVDEKQRNREDFIL